MEIDGALHDEPEQQLADERGTAVLMATGILVVRLKNEAVSEEAISERLRALKT